MTKQDQALDYAEKLGWYVFPCHWVREDGSCSCNDEKCESKGKHPLGAAVPRGVLEATTDPKLIRHWWKRYPEANVAVHCGPSGFIAFDLDSYKEIYQPDAVDALLSDDDQDTVTNLTPSPGQHLLYKNSVRYGNNRKLFPPGIDIRSWGAYIMIPPSNHVMGVYQWEADNSPFDREMREIPDKVKALLDEMERRATDGRAKAAERAFDVAPELEKVAEALTFIPNWSASDKDGGLSYDEWMAVLMAVHSSYPNEEGIAVCEAWSPGREGEIAAKWASFKAGGGITIGTLASMARANGWQGSFDADWRAGFSPVHMAIELEGAAPVVTTPHRSYPYLIRDGRLVLLKEVKTKDGDTETISQPIADFTATIAETITTEYGDQVFVIRGVGVRGGPFEVEVPAQDFGNTARLKGYLDAVSPYDGIYPKMTDHLGPAIKRLTLATTTRRRFHRTGWDKGKFLIPGREAAGAEIVLSEKAQLAYKLVPTANPALAVEALQSLMEGIGQYSTIYVAYALTGPLAALAGLSSEKYGLFARGITGSMKTTCTQLSMALWGPAFVRDQVYEKVGEFGATINGMIGRAAELCDLPFMADNFKPNTQGKESIVAFIHGIMEGFTKSRQTRAGFNARSYQLRAWPMMTGEDIPGSDTAALARLIVLDMESRAGTPQPAISRTQEIGEHLNAIGAAWLDVLEGPQGAVIAETFKATFLQYRDLFAEHIRNYSPKAENILRSASNFALNYAAWVALKQLPLIADIVASREAAHMETLFALAGDVGKHTADSLEYNRFLAILQELIVTRRVYLRPIGEVEAPLGVPVVGWYEAGCVCFYANLVRKAVEDVDRNVLNGISNTALYKQLAHANLLIPGKDGESSQTRYDPATGKAARAVVLRHEAFDNGALDPRHALAKELGL